MASAAKRVLSVCLFVFALTGIIIFVVGFATPFWVSYSNLTEGIWERCQGTLCIAHKTSEIPGWMAGVQTLECFGLLLMVAMFLLSATLSLGLPVPRAKISCALIIISVMATLLISTGCVIFLIRTQHQIQMAFTLTAITPLFTISIAIFAGLYKTFYS